MRFGIMVIGSCLEYLQSSRLSDF